MPTIRPVLCSLGLYQDPEASIDPAQRAGCQVSGIHRRCIGLIRDDREGEDGLIYLLENLGFLVHPEKTVQEPTQEIEFLGMIVGSKTRELRLPGQKMKKIRLEAAKIRDQLATPSAWEVSRLLGKFNSVSQAVPPGPLFSRALQRDLAAALESGDQCYETPCHPPMQQGRSWHGG